MLRRPWRLLRRATLPIKSLGNTDNNPTRARSWKEGHPSPRSAAQESNLPSIGAGDGLGARSLSDRGGGGTAVEDDEGAGVEAEASEVVVKLGQCLLHGIGL